MRFAIAAALLASGFSAGPTLGFELGLPADCVMGETCFLQQGADVDPAPGAESDPFCGGATYDGHDGTDIRVRSMADIGSINVIASADGVVQGYRDGVPDRLVFSAADRAAIANRECGNGVLLIHEDGWETQYCHMQIGSLAVSSGQQVKRGDVLGKIGASGFVQFPHVHLSVRHNGVKIDPFTGRDIATGCDPGTSLWAPDVAITGWEGSVLDIGIAGGPVEYDSLVTYGPPADATAQSTAIVGWVWIANLQRDDQLTVRLETADGTMVAEDTSPVDRNKAVYSAFVGKRGTPPPGIYRVRAVVVRDGVPAITAEEELEIR